MHRTFLTILLALVLAACTGNTADYHFEDAPRAVLDDIGLRESRAPRLHLSDSGTLYLLGVHGNKDGEAQLSLAMSHDGGDRFAHVVAVSRPGARVSAHGQNSPTLAFTPSRLHALWVQQEEGGDRLLAARSRSFANSFEEPVPVRDAGAQGFAGFSSIAVAPDGSVYAVWLDGRDAPQTPGTFGVYLARSTDGGASFQANTRVAAPACPCCRPSIAFGTQGEVFVAWRKVFDGDVRDIVVSTSRDGGVSFEPAVKVAEDNWVLRACPDSGPAMATREGRLFVAWYSEGGGRASVRLASSDDGARTFTRPIHASADVLDANHPALSVSPDGRLLLVFQGRDPQAQQGWSPLRPYLVEIGKGSRAPVVVAASREATASYPVVLAGAAGRTFVAWTEGDQQGSRVRLARGRRTSD